jgi:transketolase
MVATSGEGHIPSAFSVVEILYQLYSQMEEEDTFFLSKGHASAGLYATLAHFGLLDRTELDTFASYTSILGGHPSNKVKNIISSSGSLGHGLPMAAGYALGTKIQERQSKTFCLIGDGEANEGTIWEAAIHAEQLGLSNLVCIVDNNNSQTRAMISINLKEKFESFGWETSVVDGHNLQQLSEALFPKTTRISQKPLCVVANTIKGKGIRDMEENTFNWHHKAPSPEQLIEFKKELFI